MGGFASARLYSVERSFALCFPLIVVRYLQAFAVMGSDLFIITCKLILFCLFVCLFGVSSIILWRISWFLVAFSIVG